MANPQDPVKAFMESIGAVWNSAYGHWSLRVSVQRPALHIDPDEAAFLYREQQRAALKARIKQTKRFRQHEKDVLGYVRNESYYEAEIEHLEAQLQQLNCQHTNRHVMDSLPQQVVCADCGLQLMEEK